MLARTRRARNSHSPKEFSETDARGYPDRLHFHQLVERRQCHSHRRAGWLLTSVGPPSSPCIYRALGSHAPSAGGGDGADGPSDRIGFRGRHLARLVPPPGVAMRVFNSFGLHTQQAVALTAEAGFIVGGSSEGDVMWWSIGSGEMCGRIEIGPGGVTCIATSPSLSEVAVSTAFGLVMVLDARTMDQRAVSVPHALDYVASVAFRPALPGLEMLSARDDIETDSRWTEVYSELTEESGEGETESDEEFRDNL